MCIFISSFKFVVFGTDKARINGLIFIFCFGSLAAAFVAGSSLVGLAVVVVVGSLAVVAAVDCRHP